MILLYHKVDAIVKSHWYVSADTFDRQMAALQAYDVVSLDEYDPKNPRHVAITFDGIYANVWKYAAPILKKWGYPYELFVIGDHIGRDNAFDTGEPLEAFADLDMLEEMANNGARLHWHTASHRKLGNLNDAEVAHELEVPQHLKLRFPAPHWNWFAYPHDVEAGSPVEEAVRQRFGGALACFAGSAEDRYRLNRVTVTESTNLSKSTVSIIIANYNYGRYVAEAIDSVLRQTHPPDEILVIDDASTDDSRHVLQAYSDRVRIVFNEHNLGIIENFKKAVGLTSGDYIGFLGADNRMRSDYVERTKAALDANPDAAVAYTDMAIFGPLARQLAEKVHAEPTDLSDLFLWRFPDFEHIPSDFIQRSNFIHGSSLYRRAWYDKVGGYARSERPEDHDLFARMLLAGGGATRVPFPVIEYRQHAKEQANTVLSLQLQNAALRQMNRVLHDTLLRLDPSGGQVAPVFSLSEHAGLLAAHGNCKVQVIEGGVALLCEHEDPGMFIPVPPNGHHWLGVRVILHCDREGTAQLYSATAAQPFISTEHQVMHPVKKGWNILNFRLVRNSPIFALRFDPIDKPGLSIVQDLVVYGHVGLS